MCLGNIVSGFQACLLRRIALVYLHSVLSYIFSLTRSKFKWKAGGDIKP